MIITLFGQHYRRGFFQYIYISECCVYTSRNRHAVIFKHLTLHTAECQLKTPFPQQPRSPRLRAVAFKFKSRFLPWEISTEISGNRAHTVETRRK